jgi:hypothetical protein
LLGAAVAVLTALPAAGQTIGSADIIDGSIQAIDIAPETITTGRIKNETIQAIDLAPESITTGRILNRTIKAIDIATESITTGEIKNGTIAGVDMADGTITAAKLASDVVPPSYVIKANDGTVMGRVLEFNSSTAFFAEFVGFPLIRLVSVVNLNNTSTDPSDDFHELQRLSTPLLYDTDDNCGGTPWVLFGHFTTLDYYGLFRFGIVDANATGANVVRRLFVTTTTTTELRNIKSRRLANQDQADCENLADADTAVIPLTEVEANLTTLWPQPFSIEQSN